MMHVERYDGSYRARWDEFVRNSSNATFLHQRGYMDYHSDRFSDHSLMVYDDKGRLAAMLPANAVGSTLWSHQGLTYGGLLVGRRHFASQAMLDAWQAIAEHIRGEGFEQLIYKAIPHIYMRYPAEDDIYALWRMGAVMESCSISSTIDLQMPPVSNESVRQEVKQGLHSGLAVERSSDIAGFMAMLSERLMERHNAVPVHSVGEMELLSGRFPANIKLYMAYKDGRPTAGVLMYFTDTTAHTQYIASTAEGRELGAVATTIDFIARNECGSRRWIDFGTSCEEAGRVLNDGLNRQKYGMGGRPVAYCVYRLEV